MLEGHMGWNVKYLPDKKIISIVSKGSLIYQDYIEQTIKALELDEKHNTHLFLSDHSEAINEALICEIFFLPDLYDQLGASRINKHAVILPKSPCNNEFYKFFETICFNRGWKVMLFCDEQNAIKWLRPKSSMPNNSLQQTAKVVERSRQ